MVSFHGISPLKSVYVRILSPMRAIRPARFILLDSILRSLRIKQLLVEQFSSTSCHFLQPPITSFKLLSFSTTSCHFLHVGLQCTFTHSEPRHRNELSAPRPGLFYFPGKSSQLNRRLDGLRAWWQCKIYSGLSDTGIGFSPSLFGFPLPFFIPP